MNKKLAVTILVVITGATFNVKADDSINQCKTNVSLLPAGIESLEQTTDNANSYLASEDSEPEESTEESKRFELFRFEKDYNQKNVLHYGIKVNIPSCTISYKSNGAPQFSNYWIMGEEKNQKKNMTKDDLKRVGPIVLNSDEHSVRFKMNALKDINIRKKEVIIQSEIINGECKVNGYVELDDGRKVNLSRIFANISTVIGIPTGVSALTVEGNDRANGERVSVRFKQ